MASDASSGTSPRGGYDYDPLLAESTGDDESWAFIDPSGSSNPGSISFFPSPASGSLASYGVVGPHPGGGGGGGGGQVQPSPPAPPPTLRATSRARSWRRRTLYLGTSPSKVSQQSAGGWERARLREATERMLTSRGGKTDLAPFLNSFSSGVPHSGLEAFDHAALSAAQLEIPPQLQTSAHVQPWNPTHLKQDGGAMFVIEDINPSRRSPSSSFSASVSPRQPASPQSPNIKQESAGGSSSRAPIPIRRVKNARVEKKKSSSSSASPSSDPLGGGSKFVIVTPTSINAHAGKHNPFECFEAMRTTQKGRKGPLANDTKENALQVRRLGACFCCHTRKVKCDAEHPCRNCKKLAVIVPQVEC